MTLPRPANETKALKYENSGSKGFRSPATLLAQNKDGLSTRNKSPTQQGRHQSVI